MIHKTFCANNTTYMCCKLRTHKIENGKDTLKNETLKI